MEAYEHWAIKELNSLAPNGYNQTLETNTNHIASENFQKHIKKISQKCAKINYKNEIIEIYNSYHEAARKNGLDGDISATKIRNVCKGITSSIKEDLIFRDLDTEGKVIEREFKPYKGRKTIIAININNPEEEIIFESVSQAAKTLQADRQSVGKCVKGDIRYSIVKNYIFRELDQNGNIIENNIDIESRIDEYNKANPIINGERHSISEWSKIYNIKPNTIRYRIRNGWDVIKAITTPPKGE